MNLTQDQWQQLIGITDAQRPSVGRTVTVVSGKKYLGKTGKVTWHGRNEFASDRYQTDAMLTMRDLHGREGYRVRVNTEDGETFFINAENVEVI